MSWDEGFPGARASRPHQAWHSLGHLPHLDQPGTAPWPPTAWPLLFPPTGWLPAASHWELSGGQRDRMRAGRPRSQASPSRRCGADHSRKNGSSLMKPTNHQWTRLNTRDRPEDRWTPRNHKRRRNASAIRALGVTHRCHGMILPGSAGVPPAPSLAQPRPSPPLGSTGNGAMALLRPGRWGSRRQGGCLQHRTEAQRRPKGQDAGGTPALPGQSLPP